jgi:hypothetical protein
MRAGLDNWVDISVLVLYFIFVFAVGILVTIAFFKKKKSINFALFIKKDKFYLLNPRTFFFNRKVHMEERSENNQGLLFGGKIYALVPGKFFSVI